MTLPFALLVAALAVAGCGGGGSSTGPSSDETAISEVIEKSATSTSPYKCTEFQTEAFNEQDEHTSKGALKACEEDAESDQDPATKVAVWNIKVDGETATSEAELVGGNLDGQAVEVEMTKEDGAWKLNQLLGFYEYDSRRLAKVLEGEFAKEKGVTAALAKCVGREFSELSEVEAEGLVFHGEPEAYEEIVEICQSA